MRDLGFMASGSAVQPIPFAIQGQVTGVQVLAQRVITMLCRKDTDPARTFSTGVLQDVGASNVRNAEELDNDFTAAVATVRAVIEDEQNSRVDLSDDEILSDISVANIQVDGDAVYAEIDIVSLSGESVKATIELS